MHREARVKSVRTGWPARVGGGLSVLLLAAAAAAGAQETAGGNSIRGTVRDAQGAVLPGVTLTATSTDNAPPRVVVTDEDGVYEFANLPAGRSFRIQAELSAFVDFVRSGIQLDRSAPVTIDIVLQLGLSETVQVLGEEVSRSRNTIEKVQDVPLSISVVPGTELERLEATGIAAITQRLNNVTWNQGNQRTSSLSIRGVGRQGQTEAQDPSVGIIVDGVNYAYNALSSSYDFTDIDTVEVTRGPQGTLAGKNTSLGVINVTTRRPVFTPNADAAITVGVKGDVLVRAAAGGPISSKYAWRGSFSATKVKGDQTNLYNRDITYTNQDRLTGRVQLLALFTPNVSTRLQADFTPRGSETTNGRTVRTPNRREYYTDGTPVPRSTDAEIRLARRWFTQQGTYTYADYLNYDKPDTVNNDFARGLVTGNNGGSVEVNWVQGISTITSITAYKDYHFDAVNDEGTPFDIQRNAGGFWNDYQQASQEVRLASRAGSHVNYQAGFFYLNVFNSADYRREWGNDAGAWYASPVQYARLDADNNGRYLMQNSLDRLKMSFNSPAGVQKIRNESFAGFGQANWQIGDNLVLTTGLRRTHEDRQTRATTYIQDNGMAPELNPAVVNGVSLGGFASASNGTLQGTNTPEQRQVADAVALKYFGVGATGTPGGAYDSLTAAQKQQVADAKAIRQAQVGIVFPWRDAEPFQKWQTSAIVSPLYRLTDDVNIYASWQYGEKAGISQFTNGVSNLTPGEVSRSYEAGVKSVLFRRRLLLNADVFWSNIGNYQQGVRVIDAYTTANNNDGLLYYTSATGAVPKVRTQGVEVDGVLAAITNLTLRFAFAYTDGYYVSFPNAAIPGEINPATQGPYMDVSGSPLPGTYKWSFNLGPDYRIPAFGDKEIRFGANVAYNSKFPESAGSVEAWVPGKTIVDFSAGFGRQDGKFGVNLLVKNLFDDTTRMGGNPATGSYTPAIPRWVGVQFITRL